MLSKNAIGNMMNRYSAVLKKCRLLNVFGSLALTSTIALGGLAMGLDNAHAAYDTTPTLNTGGITDIIIANVKALDEDDTPSITVPTYYDEGSTSWVSYDSWADYATALETILNNAGVSSAYTVGVKQADTSYYTTFTVTDAGGTEITYGVTLDIANGYTTSQGYILASVSFDDDGNIVLGAMTNGDEDTITSTGRITNPTTTINQDFIGNSSNSTAGAIYIASSKSVETITGNFIGNNAGTNGGAIYNSSSIGTITGNFIGNSGSYGGAIYNYDYSTIGTITGDFIGNSASSYGGAIYNYYSTIGTITGDFIGNSGSSGGAIYNYSSSTIGTITGDFIGNNSASTNGGAIYNSSSSTIGTITGDFIGNSGSNGGAIYNYYSSSIGTITGDFIGNSGSYGGAIYNSSSIGTITGDFIGNSGSYGGAIYNSSTIGTLTGNFIGNSATNYGGAIYTTSSLSFLADGASYEFTNNVVGSNYNAIYIASNVTLTFTMTDTESTGTGGGFTMNDSITGNSTYTVAIGGEDATKNTFYLNDAISTNNAKNTVTVTVTNATLELGTYTHDDGSTTTGSIGGTITLTNAILGFDLGDNITTNMDDYTISASSSNYGFAVYSGTVTIDSAYTLASLGAYDGGTLITSADVTATDVTVSGGTLTVSSGTLDVSGANSLTFTGTGSTITISDDGILLANLADFGTISGTDFSLTDGYSVEDSGTFTITNGGTLTLVAEEQEMEKILYLSLLDDIETDLGLSTSDGTLTLDGVTLTGLYSLNTFIADADDMLSEQVMAGTLEAGETLIAYGLVANTVEEGYSTASIINSTANLTLTGATDTTSLVGSDLTVTNYGTLNLGEAGSVLALTYDGTLTMNTGSATNVYSAVTFIDAVTVNGGTLTVSSGTLDVSAATLSVADGASISISENGTLKIAANSFGTVSVDAGVLSIADNTTINGTITNSGTVSITGLDTTLGTTISQSMAYQLYDLEGWSDSITNTSNGTIVLDSITIDGVYSLTYLDVASTTLIGGDNTVMAGDLDIANETNNSVVFAGIVKNTDSGSTASTIEEGSTLTLTGGSTNIALLDEGSLENSGTLNLGVSGNASTANFNGTLDTTNTGTTNVLSSVTFSGVVTNSGTMNIADDVTFTSGLSLENGSTTNFNGAGSTITGAITSAGELNFTQNVTLTNTLTITDGTVSFADDMTFSDGLSVENGGVANFSGADSTITGAITSAGELNFAQNVTLANTLTITGGTINLADGSSTSLNGGVVVDSTATGTPSITVGETGSADLYIASVTGTDSATTLDFNIYTTDGSAVSLGAVLSDEELADIATAGASYSGYLYMAMGETLTLGSGSIAMNGSSSDTLYFGADTALVVNASLYTDTAVFNGSGTATITVADSSSLVLTNVSSGDYTILEDFATTGNTAWTDEQVSVANAVYMVSDTLSEDGTYIVTVEVNNNSEALAGVSESTQSAIVEVLENADTDSASYGLVNGIMESDKIADADKGKVVEKAASGSAPQAVTAAMGTTTGAQNVIIGQFSGTAAHMSSGNQPVKITQVDPYDTKTMTADANTVSDSGGTSYVNGKDLIGLNVWAMPFYQNSQTDNVKSGSSKTDSENNFGGLVLGMDKYFGDWRVGLAINAGAGGISSTDGYVDTDTDYTFWGVNLYAGRSFGDLGIIAQVGYSHGDYESVQDLTPYGVADQESDLTSHTYAASVRATYDVATDFAMFTPYVGLSYMHFEIDDYDVKTVGLGAASKVSTDDQDVWSVPFGVTIAKDFVHESASGPDWTLTPALKLGAVYAFGDLESRTSSRMDGMSSSMPVESDVVDDWTFDAGLSLTAVKGVVNMHIGYDVQVSEHMTNHGVYAKIGYSF